MENILLVEDDLTLAMALQYSLEDEGMNIELAHNLKDAFLKFKNKKFDLVLLDITLPDGTGYDFCKKIRQNNNTTPIIFLTACDDEVNIVLGLDLGADDYVTKPFRVRELIARIKAAIRRNKGNKTDKIDENILTFSNISINLLTNKVKKNDREVELTPIEYKLLVVLSKNYNQVLSRNQILSKIWDDSGEYIDNNTLSVHIRRLREKIEDEPANPKYILTVRGVGYRLQRKL